MEFNVLDGKLQLKAVTSLERVYLDTVLGLKKEGDECRLVLTQDMFAADKHIKFVESALALNRLVSIDVRTHSSTYGDGATARSIRYAATGRFLDGTEFVGTGNCIKEAIGDMYMTWNRQKAGDSEIKITVPTAQEIRNMGGDPDKQED